MTVPRFRSVFWIGFLFILLGSHVARADMDDVFDANASFFGEEPGRASMELGPWDLSLSGGISTASGAQPTTTTAPADVTLPYNGQEYGLIFPSRTYSVTRLSNGYSVQLAATRRVLTSWLMVGLQGGVSLGNKQQVEQGEIPFETFDANGNLLSMQEVGYNVDYSLLVYHVEPIVQFGPWIPLGNISFKPYVSFGGGLNQAVETVTLSAVGTDFQLERRATTAFGILTGAGVDLRLWNSGAIGAEYQYQRLISSSEDWYLGLPTLRFSYFF